DTFGASQSPAVHPFPKTGEHARLNDFAAHSYVRIEVTDVVDIGLSLQHGYERFYDSLEGWIGHGQDGITIEKKGARNGEPYVAQVIHQALFHVEAGKRCRAGVDDSNEAGIFRLI